MMDKRIAFTGPSGSGKTTLVKYVQELLNIPWINGSSGGIKTKEQNDHLWKSGLTVGKGHINVIQSGHFHPIASVENQHNILDRRIELFQTHTNFVTDRSTLDNWVYYLGQCSMYETTARSTIFRDKCIKGLDHLTHIIFIPTAIPIEDNGSRVPNFWYQWMTSQIFQAALYQHVIPAGKVKTLELNYTDLADRKRAIRDFIS